MSNAVTDLKEGTSATAASSAPTGQQRTHTGTGGAGSNAETVSAEVVYAEIARGAACRVLDVRTAGEFFAAHVAGAEHIPLDSLNAREWARSHNAGAPVYILCQSGGRARKAAAALRSAGVRECAVVDGGLDAWSGAGLPVVRGASRVLPLMRQVQLVIGTVSATGAALALWKNPAFAWIPLATGLGLTLAGATGFCGLAEVLARMPWNRRGAISPKDKSSCCSAS